MYGVPVLENCGESPLFFEGSEKKLEMVLSPGGPDLRQRDWAPVVAKANAQILSKISSPDCDAYLLSESSLFVWERRLTMITCGQTTLAEAAISLFQEYGMDQVELFIFERKNESFPQHQKSDIFTDIEQLNQHLPGKAYRFGDANEHHLFLFHLDRDFSPVSSDQTLEILMYELQGEAHDIFTESPHSLEKIRKFLKFSRPLRDFQWDDYIFKPVGYSCNALKNDNYFTIHVTPQEISPYVSFETNMAWGTREIIDSVIRLFQPKSFDLVDFKPTRLHLCEVPGYQMINHVNQSIGCGYQVSFASYYQPPQRPRQAFSLNLNSNVEEL